MASVTGTLGRGITPFKVAEGVTRPSRPSTPGRQDRRVRHGAAWPKRRSRRAISNESACQSDLVNMTKNSLGIDIDQR
jgi:hypothetical protein